MCGKLSKEYGTKRDTEFYKILKNFEYQGLKFKKGEYVRREQKELTWLDKNKNSKGEIDSVTGELYEDFMSEAERKGFRGIRGQTEWHTPKGFGRNEDKIINGRKYWGHALDRMQYRGIPFSAVENCIKNGKIGPARRASRLEYYDKVNGIEVIIGKDTGDVISVIFK